MATTTTDEAKKKFTLVSSDGVEFEVDEATAMQSQTVANMIVDDCDINKIPCSVVSGRILAMVIKYCKKHAGSTLGDAEELKSWDAGFIKVDQTALFELILAANFLNIASLLDLTCQTIADMIKEKSVEEVRTIFNITNDYTPEEEAAIRRENQWAFE